ncbi:MAG: YicC family protein [candidate division WOR-3 bacterium]|nr:MAG: YicC family protein [candidate division WOR-3 bacterium]
MAYSMTGIGRAGGEIKKPPIKFDVEIKSYNHRFLEISIKIPNSLLPFEDEIRKSIQKRVSRGHIIVIVQQDREILPCKVEVDRPLLDAYLKLVEELQKKYTVSGTIDVNTLLAIPGLIKFSQYQTESQDIFKAFQPILEKSLKSFLAMKKKEGDNIAHEIKNSANKIEDNIHTIETLIPERNEFYKKHLVDLVEGYETNLDKDRFYQELLYTVDRSDVTEECKRLHSHLSLFRDSLNNDAHPGRRLNFLLQEMQREANTLSVKANYLDISTAVVCIKEEIEKIREQVQNIE